MLSLTRKRKDFMKHAITAVSLLLLFAAVTVAQSSAPKPAPELKKWDIWIGDWVFSGRAKDTTGPEYNLDWHMHGHWILGGFFGQLETTWKGNGEEGQTLAILSYEPIKKVHIVSGFGSDGATWTATFTFDKETSVENSTITGPDGKLTRCRNTLIFSSDRMAASSTNECDDGSWWKVRGTKSKPAH